MIENGTTLLTRLWNAQRLSDAMTFSSPRWLNKTTVRFSNSNAKSKASSFTCWKVRFIMSADMNSCLSGGRHWSLHVSKVAKVSSSKLPFSFYSDSSEDPAILSMTSGKNFWKWAFEINKELFQLLGRVMQRSHVFQQPKYPPFDHSSPPTRLRETPPPCSVLPLPPHINTQLPAKSSIIHNSQDERFSSLSSWSRNRPRTYLESTVVRRYGGISVEGGLCDSCIEFDKIPRITQSDSKAI